MSFASRCSLSQCQNNTHTEEYQIQHRQNHSLLCVCGACVCVCYVGRQRTLDYKQVKDIIKFTEETKFTAPKGTFVFDSEARNGAV